MPCEVAVRSLTETPGLVLSVPPANHAHDKRLERAAAELHCCLSAHTEVIAHAPIHLGRKVAAPIFFKVVSDEKKVSHVAKLRTEQDFAALRPLLKEAYTFSLAPAR